MSSSSEPMRGDATAELSSKGATWRAVSRHVASSGHRRSQVGTARRGSLGSARGGLGGDREER